MQAWAVHRKDSSAENMIKQLLVDGEPNVPLFEEFFEYVRTLPCMTFAPFNACIKWAQGALKHALKLIGKPLVSASKCM